MLQAGKIIVDGVPNNRGIDPKIFMGQNVAHPAGILQLTPRVVLPDLQIRRRMNDVGCRLTDNDQAFETAR